ncbi:MAG: hypothetical protein HY453_01835 [Parcubacteria group bacterium]|nr:hypothetical protein [Parcubacteria group bacterium]
MVGSYKQEIHDIRVLSACPLCNQAYNAPMDAVLIEDQAEAHLLYLECPYCSISVLALIVDQASGMASVSLVTDLEASEVAVFKNGQAITDDDAYDIMDALHSKTMQREFFETLISNTSHS